MPRSGVPSIIGCPQLLIKFMRSGLVHLQRENAPCHRSKRHISYGDSLLLIRNVSKKALVTFLTQDLNNEGRSELLWQKVHSTPERANTMDPVSHKALAIDLLHFVSGFSHLRPSEKDGTVVMCLACIWKYPVRFRLKRLSHSAAAPATHRVSSRPLCVTARNSLQGVHSNPLALLDVKEPLKLINRH
jgi:hypothetical protein